MEALKKGGLAAKDMFLMENLLNQRIKEIRLLSAAVLSGILLSARDNQTQTVDKAKLHKYLGDFEEVLQKATKNLAEGKRPFGKEEISKLEELFSEIGLDRKAVNRFIASFDSLLAVNFLEKTSQVKNSLKEEKKETHVTPTKQEEKRRLKQ